MIFQCSESWPRGPQLGHQCQLANLAEFPWRLLCNQSLKDVFFQKESFESSRWLLMKHHTMYILFQLTDEALANMSKWPKELDKSSILGTKENFRAFLNVHRYTLDVDLPTVCIHLIVPTVCIHLIVFLGGFKHWLFLNNKF